MRLIAVVNSHNRENYMSAIRETWLPKVPKDQADVIFFRGRGAQREAKEDEVWLDCGDGYFSLPEKVKSIAKWALEHNYTSAAKCDDDVVLSVDKFLNSGYEQWDFNGHTNNDNADVKIPWGFLYTLSRKSLEIISTATLPSDFNDESWCSHILSQNGITLHHEPRYYLHHGKRSDFITPTKRPLRAPPRPTPTDDPTPGNGIAYCVFLHHFGYHNTPHEINIKEFHKLYKEVAQ
jgi:hypothetical protein